MPNIANIETNKEWKKMKRVRKGYCKRVNDYTILKADYYITEKRKLVFNGFENESYNHCNGCEMIKNKKCKLYEEM